MRLVLAVATLALVLAAAPPAARAQAASGGHLLTDPAGDVAFDPGTGSAVPANAPGETDCADLLSLDALESDDAVTFAVGVAGLQCNFFTLAQTTFHWHDAQYAVLDQYEDDALSHFTSATLYRLTDGGDAERVAPLNLTVDAAKRTLVTSVPKVFLMDAQNRTPSLNDKITGIKVEAEAIDVINFGSGTAMRAFDDMPNTGDGASFAFQHGDYQSGHVFLRTDDRVRVSNGGASTFVFQVAVLNNGTAPDDIDLVASALPAGWNATVQSPVHVPANGETTVPVLVSVPFAHVHGGFSSFNLTATSHSDAGSKAVLRLGILHTPIPQPAGHHSEVYLHGINGNSGVFATLFPFASGYMNTESTHDGEPAEIDRNYNSGSGAGWAIALNPALQIGVDFDMSRTGTLEGAIVAHQPQGTGTVTAKLYLTRQGQGSGQGQGTSGALLLAESSSAKISYDLQKASTFKLTMTPQAQADYIPYAKGQNMMLVLSLKDDSDLNGVLGDFCCVGAQTGPTLDVKSFKMVLPLNEYNDRLTGAADAGSTLDLQAYGPVQKTGRAGSTLAYLFDLTNDGSAPMDVKLEVAGADAKLGELVPSGTVTLQPHEPLRLTLGVHVPSNAADGQQLEVLVFAHAKSDPSKMAIERTKTIVGKGSGAADDESEVLAQAQSAHKKTPGAGTVAVLAVGALAAVAARRRR